MILLTDIVFEEEGMGKIEDAANAWHNFPVFCWLYGPEQ